MRRLHLSGEDAAAVRERIQEQRIWFRAAGIVTVDFRVEGIDVDRVAATTTRRYAFPLLVPLLRCAGRRVNTGGKRNESEGGNAKDFRAHRRLQSSLD